METQTTSELLESLLDGADQEAWRRFDERYRPILVGFAASLGLSETDSADIAQETVSRFLKSYRDGKYDRTKGRLRSWLIGIAKHCIGDMNANIRRRREIHGLSAIQALPDDARLTQIWETQHLQALIRQALAELRRDTRIANRTIDTFEMLALEGHKPAEVARRLNVSLNDVYLAKHRCLKRLRDILDQLRQVYNLDTIG